MSSWFSDIADSTLTLANSRCSDRYIFLGVLFVTWVFWNVAVFHCSFLSIGPKSIDYKDRDSFGIFNAPVYDGSRIYACVRYNPNTFKDMDAAENSARFFGAFGYIMHTLAFFMAVLVELFVYQKVQLIWTVVRILLIISFICSVLIFSMFGTDGCKNAESNMKCVPGSAGIVAIFNLCLMIGALAMSWFVYAPEHPFFYVRRWQQSDESHPTSTSGVAAEKEPHSDATQNMNDDPTHNMEEGEPLPVPPPTMDYIEEETNRNNNNMEGEA